MELQELQVTLEHRAVSASSGRSGQLALRVRSVIQDRTAILGRQEQQARRASWEVRVTRVQQEQPGRLELRGTREL